MPCKSFMNLEACTPSPSFFKCKKKFISCWQNAFIVPWFQFWSLRMCLSLLYDALKVRLHQLEREIKCRGRVHPSLLPVDMVVIATLWLLALLLHDGLCLPMWAKTSPFLLKLIFTGYLIKAIRMTNIRHRERLKLLAFLSWDPQGYTSWLASEI